MTDPAELTPLERMWDDIKRFENRERYVQQSAQTVAGRVAPYPGRKPLQGVGEAFQRMFG